MGHQVRDPDVCRLPKESAHKGSSFGTLVLSERCQASSTTQLLDGKQAKERLLLASVTPIPNWAYNAWHLVGGL